MKRCIQISRRFATSRVQWGSPIGHHAAIADKIAKMAAMTYANESMSLLTSAFVDRGGHDIRLEAAMCKLFGTEAAWRVVDETMQIRGGRGYETADSLKGRGEEAIPVERMMRDSRINTIFEGSSEIMRLFIAREALDPHLKAAGNVLNRTLPFGARFAAAIKAFGFYIKWYPKQWWPFAFTTGHGLDPRLRRHVKWARRRTRTLARRLFHTMVRFGPALEREQIVLGDFVDIGTELFAIAATCSRAQAMIDDGVSREEVLTLAEFFCLESRQRVTHAFDHIKRNNNRSGYRLARSILDGKYPWLEEGIVEWEPSK
jgi:hypothetical protein